MHNYTFVRDGRIQANIFNNNNNNYNNNKDKTKGQFRAYSDATPQPI